MTANPNDKTSYDDCGFDISHNNGILNFNLLTGYPSSREYCILKITEGTTYHDASFVNYANALIGAGCTRLGVYHFAHHGNVTAQMDFFIDTFRTLVKQVNNAPEFMFMLDLERGANPPLEQDGLSMVQYLQKIGINPIIYCGYDFWDRKYVELNSCACMLAAYNSHPTSPIPWRIPSADTYGWDLWQYTGDFLGPWAKDIPGGSHGMDLSCFNLKKNTQGFETWWDIQLAATTQP